MIADSIKTGAKEIKYAVRIDPALAARIRNIEHLKNSIYHDLNITATIDFYTYVLIVHQGMDGSRLLICWLGEKGRLLQI